MHQICTQFSDIVMDMYCKPLNVTESTSLGLIVASSLFDHGDTLDDTPLAQA